MHVMLKFVEFKVIKKIVMVVVGSYWKCDWWK